MEQSKEKKLWKNATNHIMAERVVIEAIREERERKRKSKRFRKACIRVLKFFLSTAGLFIINIAVLFLGAFIFKHLELTNEIEGCKNSRNDYEEAENATLILLMDMAQRMDGIGSLSSQGKQEVVDEFQGYLEAFALSVLDTGYDVSLDCDMLGEPGGPEPDWSLTGSLVFAVTVTTTIGYGAIAPATKWGRLVCIAYAVIGIPTFMLFLAKIGEVLANLFRVTYSTVCCCGCCRKDPEKEKTAEEEEEEEAYIQKHAAVWRIDPETGRPIPPSEEDAINEEEEAEEEEEEEEEDEEELTVPLTISVIVLFMFIIGGAFMFWQFEEDWTLLMSVYYCAITATTIGFGDLVPNTSLQNSGGLFKALATILYITFSMAGFSMCFQLIADEIVAKFQWIGEKIGVKKEEASDDDDDKNDDVENGTKDEKKTIL